MIEIAGGKMARHKAVMAPGARVTFGRSDRAGMAVPHDRRLSARHFDLFWDGHLATVRDLNSRTGTLVNGEVISEAQVNHCGWIRAGHTDWRVYHELATPAWDASDSTNQATVSALKQVRTKLTSLHAVLDASRDDRIGVLLRESVDAYRSLYDGIEADTMADSAVYVVKLQEDSQLWQRLVEEGWGRRWGIFVTSKLTLGKLRRQLRRLGGLRFYDPAVLSAFADVITADQRSELLTELTALLWESADGAVRRLTL